MGTREIGAGIAVLILAIAAVWYFSRGTPVDMNADIATTTAATTTREEPAKPGAKPPASTNAPAPSMTQFCPKFTAGVKKGDFDVAQTPDYAHGDVGKLQEFLARRYGLSEKTFVDGIFGDKTESYLKRYQKEVGLPQSGIVDSRTKDSMFTPCLKGLTANGGEYPPKSFSLTAGLVTVPVTVHEALQAQGGTVEQGAFRIELISVTGTSARVRVTGRVLDGLQTQTFTLAKGASKLTDNWPLGLQIKLVSTTSAGVTFAMAVQPTD